MRRDVLCTAVDLSHGFISALREAPCTRWMRHVDSFSLNLRRMPSLSADVVFALLASLADEVVALGRERNLRSTASSWHVAVRMSSVDEMLVSFAAYVSALVKQIDPNADDRVAVAKRYIEDHYAESVTTARVADFVGLERTYLSTVFKRRTGYTLHGYLTTIRLRNAMALIRGGDKIEAVMLSVGYRSKRSLYRMVRSATGGTPASLRSSTRTVT